ncbi:MAG: thermonuclease family protein [Capsulimonadales bacterium]|nr:thermonuclease family protein [Capsulimonadales bacterium]
MRIGKTQTKAALASLLVMLGISVIVMLVSQLRGDTSSRQLRTLRAEVTPQVLNGSETLIGGGAFPPLAPPPVRTAEPTPPPTFSAQVVRADPERFTVAGLRDQTLIRLRFWGIEFPRGDVAEGENVTQYLNRAVAGRRVFVQPVDAPAEGGVLPVKVYLGKSLINEQLVRLGYAKTTVSSDLLRDAQAQAKTLRRGIWGAETEQKETEEQSKESSEPVFSCVIKAPEATRIGKATKIKVTIVCRKGGLKDGIVNYEVHDDRSAKIAQEFKVGQSLKPGERREYEFTWKPDRKGGFRIQAGVFSKDWAANHYWNHEGLKIWVK